MNAWNIQITVTLGSFSKWYSTDWVEHEEIIFQFKINMKNNKTRIFKHIDSLYEIVGDKNIFYVYFVWFPVK